MKKIELNVKKVNMGDRSVIRTLKFSTLIIVAFFAIALLIAVIFTTLRSKKDYEIRQSETLLSNITGSIEANIDTYNDISKLLLIDPVVIKYMRVDYADKDVSNDVRFSALDVMNVSRNLDSVVLIRQNHQMMNSGRGRYQIIQDEETQEAWEREILSKQGAFCTQINGGGTIFREDGKHLISLSRAFFDINSQKHYGYMMINFSTAMLDRIIAAQKADSVCILSEDGEFLSGREDLMKYMCEDFLSDTVSHKRGGSFLHGVMISGIKMENAPFIVICETDGGKTTVPTEIIISFLIILIAFLGSVFIATRFIIKNFTSPIINMTESMEKTKESGWFEKVSIEIPNTEIGILTDSYNSMIDYLNDLFSKVIENEKEIQKAEMSVLHEQIKPHFLYNSLECINCMAMDENAPNVQKAITILGNFYRNSLSKGNREIPLSREVRIIQDYLYLQRLRYGEVLIDKYEISEDTQDLLVPKLILQPLVENSIYHGIRLKGEDGIIRISSKLVGDEIHIVVYDSGIGMPQEVIDSVLFPEEEDAENSSSTLSGFGLKGTIQRLRYYSGKEDVVSIRSEIGEYTEIEITIPVRGKESNRD